MFDGPFLSDPPGDYRGPFLDAQTAAMVTLKQFRTGLILFFPSSTSLTSATLVTDGCLKTLLDDAGCVSRLVMASTALSHPWSGTVPEAL